MSYIEYQKMLGIDVTKNEQVPHVDFDWGNGDGDKYQVYGTCYLTEDGIPLLAHTYEWDTGPYDDSELSSRLSKLTGHEVKIIDVTGGNGHYSYTFGKV